MHDPSDLSEAPLYIRWGADRSPYALELRLDLVSLIRAELLKTENSVFEIGGVLIGELPTAYSNTIRIENIELIGRDPADGSTFMLNPGQHDRFSELRWQSRERDNVAVGMFRSHIRPGPLRPSLADRTLLSGEFPGPVYALMLVRTEPELTGNFYIAAHGQLSVEPTISDFAFNEKVLGNLPEHRPAAVDPVLSTLTMPKESGAHLLPVLLAGFAVAVLVMGLAVFGYLPVSDIAAWLGYQSRQIQLEARQGRDQLRITWNGASLPVQSASSGVLKLHAGRIDRSIVLGPDDLRLGTVVVEGLAPSAQVTLALRSNGSVGASETVFWNGHQ